MSDSAIHAVSGSLAGLVAMTSTYPLIFLSTRAAVETKHEGKSVLQAIQDIIKREGLLGLYSGLESSLLAIAVTNLVFYGMYEKSRVALMKGKGLTTLEAILAGIIAGTATTIASNPIWVIQASQATHSLKESADPQFSKTVSRKPGFMETVRRLLAEDGPAAFFRGIGPALALVSNPVIQYTVFEQLKNRRIASLRASGIAATAAVLSDWDIFFLGALAKLAATSSTYPYIVMKSRLQAGHSKYKSSIDGIRTILKEEGIGGLYKGIGSKLVQSVLTAAILFACQHRIYLLTKNAITRSRIQ